MKQFEVAIEVSSEICDALKKTAPAGVTVETWRLALLSADAGEGFMAIVNWTAGVGATVVAQCIYDALKNARENRSGHVRINNKPVEINPGSLLEALERNAKIQADGEQH